MRAEGKGGHVLKRIPTPVDSLLKIYIFSWLYVVSVTVTRSVTEVE